MYTVRKRDGTWTVGHGESYLSFKSYSEAIEIAHSAADILKRDKNAHAEAEMSAPHRLPEGDRAGLSGDTLTRQTSNVVPALATGEARSAVIH